MSHFYKMHAHLSASLKSSPAKVLAYILNNAQKQAYCYAAYETIGLATNMHRSTVQASLKKLVELKYVRVVPKFNGKKQLANWIYPLAKCLPPPSSKKPMKLASSKKLLNNGSIKSACQQIAIAKSAIAKIGLDYEVYYELVKLLNEHQKEMIQRAYVFETA